MIIAVCIVLVIAAFLLRYWGDLRWLIDVFSHYRRHGLATRWVHVKGPEFGEIHLCSCGQWWDRDGNEGVYDNYDKAVLEQHFRRVII